MGRRQKVALDYYYVQVNTDQVEKLLKAKFGLEGVGVITQLKRCIFGDKGYYMEWTDDDADVFSAENYINRDRLDSIIDFLCVKGIFDRSLRDSGVLTSKDIQDQYIAASLKRTSIEIKPEYLLTDPFVPAWSSLKVLYGSEKIKKEPEKIPEKPKKKKSVTKKEPSLPYGNDLYRAALDIYEQDQKIPRYDIEKKRLSEIFGWMAGMGILSAPAISALAKAHKLIMKDDKFWAKRPYLPSAISYNMFNNLVAWMQDSHRKKIKQEEDFQSADEILEGMDFHG